jgi:hypothetical protein
LHPMAVGSGDFVGWRGAVVICEGSHRSRRRSYAVIVWGPVAATQLDPFNEYALG